MNLTDWAHAQGIHVQTACRWYREGTLPVPGAKVGRLILVSSQTAAEAARKAEGLYARVSSHDRKSGLDGQVARLSAWAAEAGLPVVRVEAEAGSADERVTGEGAQAAGGPGGDRRGAGRRDRLGRMNTELAEAALSAHNRRLVVLDDFEVTADLVRDMVEVLTLLCARLCGRRPARDRVLTALGCARQGIGPGAVKLRRLRWRRVSVLREIAEPFVVAPPAGVRVRTRLRVCGVDAAVLR